MEARRSDGPVSARPGRPGGFTLAEMLVAIVVTGILAAGVVGLLLEQNRFYGQHDDLVFAQQTLRGAADLLTRELRMAGQGDVLYAGGDSVLILSDRVRGAVCRVDGSTVTYYRHAAPDANVTGTSATAYLNPGDQEFSYDRDWDGTGQKASSGQIDDCADNGSPELADAGVTADDFWTTDWSTSGLPVPEVGAAVRVSGRLAYHFAESSFADGLALWRNNQELVAPFADGANFEYVTEAGVSSSLGARPYSDRIVRIRINATAVGGGGDRYDVSRDLSYDLSLRN